MLEHNNRFSGQITEPAVYCDSLRYLNLKTDVLSALCLDAVFPLFSAEALLDHLDTPHRRR